jgi:hypothetical protein
MGAVSRASNSAPQEEFLWPCNVPTWLHWQEVQTQWRVGGMGGATGLDYAGVRAYLDDQDLPASPNEKVPNLRLILADGHVPRQRLRLKPVVSALLLVLP